MNFENIIEKRSVQDGMHKLLLEISAEEYQKDYNQYNNDIAFNIVFQHLQKRGDDGRPSAVKIYHDDKNNIVKISANVDYLDNDHTEYIFR